MVNLVKYLVPKGDGIFSKGGFAAVFSVEIMRELTTIILYIQRGSTVKPQLRDMWCTADRF